MVMRARQPRRPQFSDEVLVVAAARVRMLCEPMRIRLLLELEERGDATVQQLADRLGTAHRNASKHLNLLYDAGMVRRRKHGREVCYGLVDYVAVWVIEQIASSAADHIEQLHELFHDTGPDGTPTRA
jgi:DNA-binding transcriptional ArsR family regulator